MSDFDIDELKKDYLVNFKSAIDDDDVEKIADLLLSPDFLAFAFVDYYSEIVSSKDVYNEVIESGLEDFFYSNQDLGTINEIAIASLKHKNIPVLDFIVNNSNELDFDINTLIKNRSLLEVALFFNSSEAVELLLNSGIVISTALSNYCSSWITDNFVFLDNPMHMHFKDEQWRGNFMKILLILKKYGWSSISNSANSLLKRNNIKNISEANSVLTSGNADIGRLIRRINDLDPLTIKKIKDSLTV